MRLLFCLWRTFTVPNFLASTKGQLAHMRRVKSLPFNRYLTENLKYFGSIFLWLKNLSLEI